MKLFRNFINNQKGFTTFSSHERGFTLIELLVVIGILAILLAITLIAINPARQFSQANNTQRSSDVNSILNAINQYMADNNGTPPTGITATAALITDSGVAGTVDLCAALVPTYMADLPLDPTTGTESPTGSICTDALADYSTGYNVSISASNSRLTVIAPDTELGIPDISVTR